MPTETLRPDGELSDVGLVANSELDHDEDPDVSSATVNATGNNVNTEWGADFPTPTGNPTVGADLQEFRVGVEEFDPAQSGTPDAHLELWENGSLVRAGSNTPVSAYAVLSLPWNANELADPTGAGVQCKCIGTKSGGAPGARNSVRIGHVEWNADYSVSGAEIVGSISFGFSMSAGMAFNQNPQLTGDVPMDMSPASQLAFNINPALIGDVPMAMSPAALLAYNINPALVGNIPIDMSPLSPMLFNINPSILGDVPLDMALSAVMNFSSGNEIVGSIAFDLSAGAVMAFNINPALVGDVPMAMSPAALLAYNINPALVGNIPIDMSPLSPMLFNINPAILGNVPMGMSVAAIMILSAGGPATDGFGVQGFGTSDFGAGNRLASIEGSDVLENKIKGSDNLEYSIIVSDEGDQ